MNNTTKLARKLNILTLLIGGPLWPKREDLTESGKKLYDTMNEGTCNSILKEYCGYIIDLDYKSALKLIEKWSTFANELMDDPLAINTKARREILYVFIYFVNLLDVDFNRLVTL